MKKAYVKPVFLAEEFVAASSYAASPCGVSERKPYELEIGDQLCPDGDSGHYVGGQSGDKGTINENWHYDNSYTNWQYATKVDNKATIFMDKACDFFWDPDTGSDGNVYVWDNVDEQLRNNKYTGDGKNGTSLDSFQERKRVMLLLLKEQRYRSLDFQIQSGTSSLAAGFFLSNERKGENMALTSTIQDLFYQEARIKRYPVSVNFELLPVCNLRCKMCYIQMDMNHVRTHGGLRSAEEWIALARKMRDSGTLFLLLSGGEAFLYPDFRRLYIELYKMGFWITINTNGTLIDESVVSWLKEYPPKIVSMSLYGASDETYQKVCGQKGIFSRVKHAIQLLAENHIRFELKTMYTPLNVEDWDQCWDLAAQFGAYYEAANYAFPPARKANREGQIRFSASECAELAIRTNQRESKGNEYVQKVLNHLQKYEDTKGIPGGELYGFTCGATRSTCWITWQGHMTPCAMLEEPYTLPFEQGFSAAWEELKEKCDRILMSPKCSHCDKRAVCTVCPAACYAETGSFEKHSLYHCRMTEYILESMERQVKEWGIEDRIVRRNEEK